MADALIRELRELPELLYQPVIAADRALYDRREEGCTGEKCKEIVLRLRFPPVHVREITDRGEGVIGKAERNHDLLKGQLADARDLFKVEQLSDLHVDENAEKDEDAEKQHALRFLLIAVEKRHLFLPRKALGLPLEAGVDAFHPEGTAVDENRRRDEDAHAVEAARVLVEIKVADQDNDLLQNPHRHYQIDDQKDRKEQHKK